MLDYEYDDISPCLYCPNHKSGIDKRLCLRTCKRLAAYQDGRDWRKEEIVVMAKKLTEKDLQGLTQDEDMYPDPCGRKELQLKEEFLEEMAKPEEPLHFPSKAETNEEEEAKTNEEEEEEGSGPLSLTQGKRPGRPKKSVKEQPVVIYLDPQAYRNLSKALYIEADRLSLTVQHVAITLIAEAILVRSKRE